MRSSPAGQILGTISWRYRSMMATLTLILLGCSVGGKSRAGKIGVGSGWVNGYSSGEVYRRTLAVGSKQLTQYGGKSRVISWILSHHAEVSQGCKTYSVLFPSRARSSQEKNLCIHLHSRRHQAGRYRHSA